MIRALAAIDEKRGLAKHDRLPWRIPMDIDRYTKLMRTNGGTVLVGRKTYEQMGSKLEGLNIILATRTYACMDPVIVVDDIKSFLKDNNGEEDIWVLGGGKVFEESLEYIDELWLTEIEGDYKCDVFFPEFKNKYVLASESGPFEQNGCKFHFRNYTRIN